MSTESTIVSEPTTSLNPWPATLPAALPKNLLGVQDLGPALPDVIAHAMYLKAEATTGQLPQLLAGTATALVFEKPSTRTRVSLELGIARLGGVTTTLDARTTQIGRGESIEDTAGALSRYADAIVVRTKSHACLEEFAEYATVPVVNALTDKEHPLQTLADLMTMAEEFPASDGHELSGLKGLKLAWVGDGNNVCHSLLLGAAMCGMHVKVATPPGYEPDAQVLDRVKKIANGTGGSIHVTNDPQEAVQGAHVVETDTWRSMGTENEAAERLVAFHGFTVDAAVMALAEPEAVFLHCMPGHWGEEATHAVAHGTQSRIFDQAENRMWTQMAVLVGLSATQI